MFSWCLAKNKIRNPELFGKISIRICEVLMNNNQIEILNTEDNKKKGEQDEVDQEDLLESDLEISEPEQEMNELEKQAYKIPISKVSPQSLTLFLWAFAKNRMKDEELFEIISKIMIENFEKFSPKMINIALFAFKELNIKSKV